MFQVALIFVFFILQINLLAEELKNKGFYILGFETISANVKKTESDKEIFVGISSLNQFSNLDYKQKLGKSVTNEQIIHKAALISEEENASGLNTIIKSFQNAIKDLCVSQIELNLGFNVSAKTWILINGDMAGSVKIVIKNQNTQCQN